MIFTIWAYAIQAWDGNGSQPAYVINLSLNVELIARYPIRSDCHGQHLPGSIQNKYMFFFMSKRNFFPDARLS